MVGLFAKLQRWAGAIFLWLGACGTVSSSADGGGSDGPMPDAAPCSPACSADQLCDDGTCVTPPAAAIDTRWADPTGSTTPSGALMMTFVATGIAGTIYECRTGPAASFTETTPPWTNCDGGSGMNPTYQPQLPSGVDDGGSFRTEHRYRVDAFVSNVDAYDYYVHNSLNAVGLCPLAQPPAAYFMFAKTFNATTFPTANTFPTDGSVQLRNPFIRIPFRGATTGESVRSNGFILDGMANRFPAVGFIGAGPFDYPFGVNSLRHRYVLSADNTMILMARQYRDRDGSCRQQIRVSAPQGVTPPHDVTCDAYVVNATGQGLCLAGNPIAAVLVDQHITGVPVAQAGTVSGAAGSTVVTGVGTAFGATWVGCYLRTGYRWHRIVTVTNATTLTLSDPLRFAIGGAPQRYCGPVVDVFVSPTGYMKLRNDDRPLSGSLTSKNKCTSGPACNDVDPSHVNYLPP